MRKTIEKELTGNILPFWERLVGADGRFPGRVDIDGTSHPEAPVGAVMAFRMLWMFSAVSRYLKDERSGTLADRLYGYVTSAFVDKDN